MVNLWAYPDILEPNYLSMVLESDAAFPWKVLEGTLELIVRAIGILAGGIPVVEVHAEGLASIDVTGNDRTLTTKNQLVPLSDRLGEVLGRSHPIIEGTIQLAGRQLTVMFFLKSLVVHQLELKTTLYGVIFVGSVEDA